MVSVDDIEAQLTGSGGIFELAVEQVLGEQMAVFRHRERSLREYLEKSQNHADKEYIVCEERRISFREHFQLVALVAERLATQYGVKRGDRVAILAANHPEWIICFWATVSLGAICVGLNGWWTRKEILYGLDNCEPVLLVGDAKRLARIENDLVSCPIVTIDESVNEREGYLFSVAGCNEPRTLASCEIAEDDPALILYTSGTTGRPKGAVISHRGLINFVASNFFNGIRSMMIAQEKNEDVVASSCGLYTAPLFHLSGLFSGAISGLAAGLKTVWTTQRFDAENVLRLIESEQVGHWASLGSMADRVLDCADFDKYDISSLRIIGSGGAPTSAEQQKRIQAAFTSTRGNMAVGYGLTESTGVGTTNMGEFLVRCPDSVGRPMPGIEVSIRDDKFQPLAEGQQGEVCIRGSCVMLEYWRNPKATAQSIAAGRWLKTGDVGYIKDKNLYINSRARDMILRNAENIYPVEIEQCLERHPAVKEAAVIGVDHYQWGQEVKAIVVPCSAEAAMLTDSLKAHCLENLAAFKVPTQWELRRTPLPRNAAGKIMKNVLSGYSENDLVEE